MRQLILTVVLLAIATGAIAERRVMTWGGVKATVITKPQINRRQDTMQKKLYRCEIENCGAHIPYYIELEGTVMCSRCYQETRHWRAEQRKKRKQAVRGTLWRLVGRKLEREIERPVVPDDTALHAWMTPSEGGRVADCADIAVMLRDVFGRLPEVKGTP